MAVFSKGNHVVSVGLPSSPIEMTEFQFFADSMLREGYRMEVRNVR